jgi:hypothetical protein
MIKSSPQLADLEALCQVCPPIQEITAALVYLGFELVFHMPATNFTKRTCGQVPALPPQYHFVDTHNTEVIVLLGTDHPKYEHRELPPHASRWWLYAGSNLDAYNLVKRALSTRWKLSWIEATT